MSRVLLGVTGSIAAYKACELTRLLVKAGHEVVPLVTPGAERFVTRETFVALARRPADEDAYPHLERADLLVVAPLSANTLAKLAYGIADTLVTEAALAHTGPVLVAPAMNHRMWSNAATQENVATLLSRGIDMIGPDEGEPWTVALEPTSDVLRAVAAALPRNGQVRVAFGAELGADGLERKRRMLAEKDVDLVVFNDVSRVDIGFESVDNEVVLITAA